MSSSMAMKKKLNTNDDNNSNNNNNVNKTNDSNNNTLNIDQTNIISESSISMGANTPLDIPKPIETEIDSYNNNNSNTQNMIAEKDKMDYKNTKEQIFTMSNAEMSKSNTEDFVE